MYSIRPLPEFTAWIDALKDETVRGESIWARAGACYFTKRGTQIVVLLVGGSKRTQTKDIKRAKALAALLD